MAERETSRSCGEDRPSTDRRSLITGGAVGLAAVAGAALGGAAPASATTAVPSVTDWIDVTDYGAKGDGKTDDWSAINTVLGKAVPGHVVYLPVGNTTTGTPGIGKYLITQPLIIPEGVCLRGPTPANDDAGAKNPDNYGAVIQVAPHGTGTGVWKNNALLPNQAAVVLTVPGATVASTGTSTLHRPGVENLWIDGSANTQDTVDGIAGIGSVFHATIRNVGVLNASGSGIAAYDVLASMVHYRADGWLIDSCILQSCAVNGVNFYGEDTLFRAVHAQTSTGDNFVVQHSNNRLVACRADGSASGNGFTIDTANSLQASVTLSGCGTEGNKLAGLNVVNQIKPNTINGMVLATGCSFDFDGTNGIAVDGENIVVLIGCNVTAGTTPGGVTGPTHALSTKQDSSTGTPVLVQAIGGFWNSIGTLLVNDNAPAQTMSYSVHCVTGGQIGSTGASGVVPKQNNPL